MRLTPLVALAAVGVLLSGCGKGGFSDRVEASRAPGTFIYPIVTTPTSFDPGNVRDGDTLDLLQQVYEGLVGWDENNEPVGLLAEGWAISDEGKTWTFTLKQGVKFHNGREVVAEDVKWSLERACNSGVKSATITAYLSDIVGMEERKAGEADNIAGVTVIDDYTIEFKLKQPTPYFLGKLTYLVSAVLPKESVPEDGVITQVEQMVGTGPYKVKEYHIDSLVVLERNEDYHGEVPQIKVLERPIIGDAAARLSEYKLGNLDFVMLERQDIDGLDEDLQKELKYFPRPAIWYVGMNQQHFEPFKDKRVRQAFAMVINKELIVNDRMGGVNQIANSIVPPGVPGHQENADGALPYDPNRARELLAEAGYPGGEGIPPITMNFREGRTDVRIVGEAVASMLEQELGVEISIQMMEWNAYLEKENRGELNFFHMRWAADFLDPQNFLSHMLASFGPENKLGYINPEFDSLCRQADSIMEMEDRIPLYQQAENIVLDDAVWVPIYFQRDVELHRPELQGMRSSLFGHLPHTQVTVDR